MKTLALNMIVGPNDGDLLERCLESIDARATFDEIVIVLTSGDQKVPETAKKYTQKVIDFKWSSPEFPFGNFGGARQMALDNTESDYVMWLDADDVIDENLLQALNKLRTVIEQNDFDCYRIKYLLQDGQEFLRERVFKRTSAHWKYPVHEQLIFIPDFKHATMEGLFIRHAQMKMSELSSNRNLNILIHYNDLNPNDACMKFFLARECFTMYRLSSETQYMEKAVNLAESMLTQHQVASDDLAYLCLEVAQLLKCTQQAEIYLMLAKGLSDVYAETDVLLGDIYSEQGQTSRAIASYRSALSKKLGAGGSQMTRYYKEIPFRRLVLIYSQVGKWEMSIYYMKELIKLGFKEFIGPRKDILQKMMEEF